MSRWGVTALLLVGAAGVFSGSLFVRTRFTMLAPETAHMPATPPLPVALSSVISRPASSVSAAAVASVPESSSVRGDLALVLQRWQALPDDAEKAEQAANLGFELARANPIHALSLAIALPESPARSWLLTAIVQAWATREPHAAAAWAGALSAGDVRTRAIENVVDAWSYADAPTAARWAGSLPDAPAQRAIGRAVSRWSGSAPHAAGEWIAQLAPGAARETAVATHITTLAIEGPATAAQWLSSLPPADQSPELIERLARQWLAINRAEALRWLERTPLSAEHRRQLLLAAP